MEELRFTEDLIADGYSHTEVARMARSGALQRIRRGAYDPNPPASDPAESHRRLIAATVRTVSVEAVVSHLSAAVLHGLPSWSDQLGLVHLTRNSPGGGKIRRLTHVHASPLAGEDICIVGGQAVTTVARTVLDLARTMPMERSVPIGDAALRRGLPRAELEAIAARCAGWRGMTPARRAIAFLDPRSESVGESYSRVVLHQIGLPSPTPQFEVFDGSRLIGRVDFCWEDQRTLGEFDGKEKYGRLLAPGQDPGEVVFQEKRREDAMRDLGWEMTRWTWADLFRPAQLRQRVMRALARSRR